MALQPVQQFPITKGVVASNQPLAEPKGAIIRGSNMLYTARGGLDVCDGTAELFEYNGAIQINRRQITCNFLFEPLGVNNYYLSIQKVAIALGPPQNLTVSSGAGGFLGGTNYYRVTALDGVGGETTASIEASGTGSLNTLTWNVVPNAVAYNVYRGASPGTEELLSGAGLPVRTNTFADNGTAVPVQTSLTLNPATSTPPGATKIFSNGLYFFYFTTTTAPIAVVGQQFVVAGVLPITFDGTYTVSSITGNTIVAVLPAVIPIAPVTGGGGTLTVDVGVPTTDNTQQTALYRMPVLVGAVAPVPFPYTNADILALWPADPGPLSRVQTVPIPPEGGLPPGKHGTGGGGGAGGSGGGGGTGVGGSTGPGTPATGQATPSGGVPGNISYIPQMKQFTNRVVIALGNGFPLQICSDPATTVNGASSALVALVQVNAFGVQTVNTSGAHNLQVGSNVVLFGFSDPAFTYTGPVIAVISGTEFQVRNLAAIGHAQITGGSVIETTRPVKNLFVPSFPSWAPNVALNVGDVIEPTNAQAYMKILTVTQAGVTGTGEPNWGNVPVGGSISEGPPGTVIYKVSSLTVAPPPPGGAHIEIYSDALWVINTAVTDTADGLDGPCSLRMANIGTVDFWDTRNQVFIDRDDGTEGMGLAKFTITAVGIPPEGSLIAFKNYLPYQIIGLFGSANNAIQAVSTDMGVVAPRTIQFVPGYGIVRFTHLGFAVFNGVKDEVISEQIRPYLFPQNDLIFQDILVIDSNWVGVSWGAQTATPPMYVCAMPIGNSQSVLSRIFAYDLIFKAWAIVDLPFGISTMSQFRTLAANPVTVFGGWWDGCISRWQSGDIKWDTGGTGARTPSAVQWSFDTLTVASQNNDARAYVRRFVLTGINKGAGTVTAQWNRMGVPGDSLRFTLPNAGDVDLDVAVQSTGKRYNATISGNSDLQVDGLTWEVEARPSGVVVSI